MPCFKCGQRAVPPHALYDHQVVLSLVFVTDASETPSRITRGFPPVSRSHTRTVASSLPLTTTRRPSSSPTATALTLSVWPVKGSSTGHGDHRFDPRPGGHGAGAAARRGGRLAGQPVTAVPRPGTEAPR